MTGPVAHLVERFHGMEEAVGSIPIRSTTTPRLRCAQRGRGFSFIPQIHSLELNNFRNMIFTRLIYILISIQKVSMTTRYIKNSIRSLSFLANATVAVAAILLFSAFTQPAVSNATRTSAETVIEHVILISVDGLRPEAMLPPLVDQHPAMKQLTQGAWTAQARCDPDISITLPNHIDMITGRLVAGKLGHGWVGNTDPPSRTMGGTLHLKNGQYISSVFDVAHDAGVQTAMISGKWKFVLFEQSYGEDAGGPDDFAPNYGKDKIDCFVCSPKSMDQVQQLAAFIQGASDRQKKTFTFLHLALPDFVGHASGWDLSDGSPYRQALIDIDHALGAILSKINNSPTLKDRVAIVLTADHGGGVPFVSHLDPEAPVNFTIPFVVWSGMNQTPMDLYSINTTSRHCPAVNERFSDNPLPPIRNADAGNTCLMLLGLPAIPGSTVNARQDLLVAAPSKK